MWLLQSKLCRMKQVLEAANQQCQLEQRMERQEHADMLTGLSKQLQAHQDSAGLLKEAAQLQQRTEADLAQTQDQLRAALAYRKTCKSQEAEIKRLQAQKAETKTREQRALDKARRTEKRLAAIQAMAAKSQLSAGSQQEPLLAASSPAEPAGNTQSTAGADAHAQASPAQADALPDDEKAALLQRAEEAEARVRRQAQRHYSERKNVKEAIKLRDERLKNLEAECESYKQQLGNCRGPQQPCPSTHATSGQHVSPWTPNPGLIPLSELFIPAGGMASILHILPHTILQQQSRTFAKGYDQAQC